MTNLTITRDGDDIVIRASLKTEGTPSNSGKSVVLASTHGNVTIPGTDVTLGLNLYRKVRR
jgi:hypothetical protein